MNLRYCSSSSSSWEWASRMGEEVSMATAHTQNGRMSKVWKGKRGREKER